MNKIKAVIFDMDGVLVDNFKPWLEFDRKFSSHFGFSIDEEYIRYVNGRSEEETVKWVKSRFALANSEKEIMAFRQANSRAIYEVYAQPIKGAEKLVKKIIDNNITVSLCSGAKMWQIEIILDRFQWRPYFKVIVSSDHVGYEGKPNPEIYLHTAKLLNINPADCVVVEDAENGVEAAKNAGMKCIGFKNPRFNLPDNLSKADLIVESLEDKKILDYLNL